MLCACFSLLLFVLCFCLLGPADHDWCSGAPADASRQFRYVPGESAATGTPVCYEIERTVPAPLAGVEPGLVPTGRVVKATATVVRGGKTKPGEWAKQYCNILFDPSAAWDQPGTSLHAVMSAEYEVTYSRAFEVGHIIAASLGGANQQPINFFPQWWKINRGPGSVWSATSTESQQRGIVSRAH